jgi:hypothetical protein
MLTLRDRYKMKDERRSSVFQQMEVNQNKFQVRFSPFEAFFSLVRDANDDVDEQ